MYFCIFIISCIMSGYCHNCTSSITTKYKVTNKYRNFFSINWINCLYTL